jgi:hypothetical protein
VTGSDVTLGEDEVIVRRIPPGDRWLEPPDRVTSANFKLAKGETGLSVFRLSIVTPEYVLSQPGVIPGSFLVAARVRDVRTLRSAAGASFSLEVVADDDDGRNPGHAEIRGPVASKLSQSCAKALRDLFQRVDKSEKSPRMP